jgi:hypothetical protein
VCVCVGSQVPNSVTVGQNTFFRNTWVVCTTKRAVLKGVLLQSESQVNESCGAKVFKYFMHIRIFTFSVDLKNRRYLNFSY